MYTLLPHSHCLCHSASFISTYCALKERKTQFSIAILHTYLAEARTPFFPIYTGYLKPHISSLSSFRPSISPHVSSFLIILAVAATMMVDDFTELNPNTCVVLGGRGFLGRSLVLKLLTLGRWIVRIADSAPSLQLDHFDRDSIRKKIFI